MIVKTHLVEHEHGLDMELVPYGLIGNVNSFVDLGKIDTPKAGDLVSYEIDVSDAQRIAIMNDDKIEVITDG